MNETLIQRAHSEATKAKEFKLAAKAANDDQESAALSEMQQQHSDISRDIHHAISESKRIIGKDGSNAKIKQIDGNTAGLFHTSERSTSGIDINDEILETPEILIDTLSHELNHLLSFEESERSNPHVLRAYELLPLDDNSQFPSTDVIEGLNEGSTARKAGRAPSSYQNLVASVPPMLLAASEKLFGKQVFSKTDLYQMHDQKCFALLSFLETFANLPQQEQDYYAGILQEPVEEFEQAA